MGKCKYCGVEAGFLRQAHPDCRRRHKEGKERLEAVMIDCFQARRDFYTEQTQVSGIRTTANLTESDVKDVYCKAFDKAIDRYLDNGIIDTEEEKMVARFMQFTGLDQNALNRNMSLEKVVQSRVLQEILQGNKPTPRITVQGDFPFILSKTETLVWVFRNVIAHEQKVHREYRGRSNGMSFRIAKGVYYRVGGFRGAPVETTYMQRIGIGSVCLTDKNLYFSCPEKSFKIPYSKILSIDTYSNGFSIQRDGANAKPIVLERINSWFCYNVIANLK